MGGGFWMEIEGDGIGRERTKEKKDYICMHVCICMYNTYIHYTYITRAHKNSQRDALTHTNTTGLVASEAKREIGQFIREHKDQDSLSATAHLGYVQASALEPTTSVQQTLQTVPSGGPRRHNRKPRERDTKLVSV